MNSRGNNVTVCGSCNRDRDVATSLIINSQTLDRGTGSGTEGSGLGLVDYVSALRDWWICTTVITKVKILGFILLPCLAIGLYIFHYIHHPGSLHNPIAVLHPFAVVHPLIPTPFQSTFKFLEEKGRDLLSNRKDVFVKTKNGPITGRRVDPNPVTGVSYDAFLGIPYGYIPARFQRAVRPRSWMDSRPALSDSPACPQPGSDFSEDCLTINIYTPKDAVDSPKGYPVVVFIHGSGFTWGSSSSERYGPDFLVPEGVILVTFNYRLGAVGFLTLGSRVAPGNMGLYDTRLALLWVQNEIHNFGGDTRQVTLMGQGAGAVLAMYHYLSPSSVGLFRYVIAQSGSALAGWGHYTAAEGAARARRLADAVGCDSSANDTQVLACLRVTNITDIVENQNVPLDIHYEGNGQTVAFLPVLDTDFADKPFFSDTLKNWLDLAVNRSKPMIIGFTADEGIVKFAEDSWRNVESNLDSFIPTHIASSFSDRGKAVLAERIRRRYFHNSVEDSKVLDIVRILQDHMIVYPTLQVAQKLANSSYGYVFDFTGPWTPDPSYITEFHLSGVNHGFDLRYLFYSQEEPQDLGNCSLLKDSLKVRDMIVGWWTGFVKTGSPGNSWPKISEGGFLKINTNATLIDSPTMEKEHNYAFWLSLETAEDVKDISAATSVEFNFFIIILGAVWSNLFNRDF